MRHKIDFCQIYLLSGKDTFRAYYYAKTRRATCAWFCQRTSHICVWPAQHSLAPYIFWQSAIVPFIANCRDINVCWVQCTLIPLLHWSLLLLCYALLLLLLLLCLSLLALIRDQQQPAFILFVLYCWIRDQTTSLCSLLFSALFWYLCRNLQNEPSLHHSQSALENVQVILS